MRILKTLLLLLVCVSVFGQDIPPPPPPPPPPGYTPAKPTKVVKYDPAKHKPLSQLLPSTIENNCGDGLTRLKGSTVQFKLPAGYKEKSAWNYEKKDYEIFHFVEVPHTVSFSYLADSMKRGVFEGEGKKVDFQFSINGQKAALFESISPHSGFSGGMLVVDLGKTILMCVIGYELTDPTQVEDKLTVIKAFVLTVCWSKIRSVI